MDKVKRKNTEIRSLIMVAKVVSTLFRPMYYPVLCWAILMTLTPLSRFPIEYKVVEMGILAGFTILLPLTLTYLYRLIRHLNVVEMRKRKSRIVPYIIFIVCYIIYLFVMLQYPTPNMLLSVIVVAILIQLVCTVLSFFWKVSVHAAGSGAIVGAILAYSSVYMFNPLFWLCIAFLVAGLVGTSRMILRQHNLSQVLVGTLIGMVCGFVGIRWGVLLLELIYLLVLQMMN